MALNNFLSCNINVTAWARECEWQLLCWVPNGELTFVKRMQATEAEAQLQVPDVQQPPEGPTSAADAGERSRP